MNNVANFNFNMHCRSAIQNILADSLSWYPPIEKGNTDDYTLICTADEVKVTFNETVTQSNDNET